MRKLKALLQNRILRETRESNYWMRILIALDYKADTFDLLWKESKELKNIFGAIVAKSREK